MGAIIIIIIIIMQKPQGVINSLYYPLKHWVWKRIQRKDKKTSIFIMDSTYLIKLS
jgi:hypothetical protein